MHITKFTVYKNIIKNPNHSQVYNILNRILEDEYAITAFNVTKAATTVLPKKSMLSYWPHVDLKGCGYGNWSDPAYIFYLDNLKSLGTNITGILSKLLDFYIKKQKLKPDGRKNLKSIFEYMFNKNLFRNVIGEGFDREGGFNQATRVYDLGGGICIKMPTYKYSWGYAPDLKNWTFLTQKYTKLKTYKGSVLLKTSNLKVLESVGKHEQAGVSSFKNRFDKEACLDYYKNTYLKRFSSVPQNSFDDIALDFATLNTEYSKDGKYTHFAFENPNNIILKGDKLYLVDELTKDYTEVNSTSHYLFNMLSIVHQFDLHNYVNYGEALPYAQIIFKKILKSCALAKLPAISKDISSTYMLKQVLANFKIKTPVEDVITEFEKINKIPNKNTRVKTMEKYTDKLLGLNKAMIV